MINRNGPGMMNRLTERALVVLIYAVSGAIFGASIFAAKILGPLTLLGALIGGFAGIVWSLGKEFRDVWRAGLGFAAAGLAIPIIIIIMMMISKAFGCTPEYDQMTALLLLVLSGWACGSLFGTGILSRRRIVAARQAALAGGAVGFLAAITFCMWTLTLSQSDDGGAMLTGQLILTGSGLVLGATAGYILFKIGIKQDERLAYNLAINSRKTLHLKINPSEELERYGDRADDSDE